MATQWLTLATLAGQAANAVSLQFDRWRVTPDPQAVDQFCLTLRENALSLPVVYFAQWVDRWLMGNSVPGPGSVEGARFQIACLSPEQAAAWANQCGSQFVEQEWLASRLREASVGWGTVNERYAVLVIREVIGPSTTDDEVEAALDTIPAWLSSICKLG